MRDIVARLRDMQCEEPCSPTCCIDTVRAEAADVIEELQAKLMHIGQHPDTPELIKQYANGMLDGNKDRTK